MIYFMESAGRVKIGYSENPVRRVAALSTASPMPCTLIGVTEGDRAAESAIHERFKAHRRNREWFDFHREINDYLRENAIHAPAPKRRGPKNAPPRWNEISAAAKACGARDWAMRKWLVRCEIPAVWKLRIMEQTKGKLKLDDMVIVDHTEARETAA